LKGRTSSCWFARRKAIPDRLPTLARDLVGIPVDVIVAGSAQASLAAKGATRRIPIVAVYVFDPVKAGLVTSLARPGGNVTGLSAMATDYVGKMLQVSKRLRHALIASPCWVIPGIPRMRPTRKSFSPWFPGCR
jgi:putative ABC transport system substrate-binding protein